MVCGGLILLFHLVSNLIELNAASSDELKKSIKNIILEIKKEAIWFNPELSWACLFVSEADAFVFLIQSWQ